MYAVRHRRPRCLQASRSRLLSCVNTGPLKPARRRSRTVTSTEAAHWAKSNRSLPILRG